MNRNLILGAIGVLVLLGLGYFLFMGTPPYKWPSAPESTPTPTSIQEQATESASLGQTVTLSEQNNSGESGTATLLEGNGKVKLVLKITGAPAGVTQPAHIHTGSCPEVGAVKYPLTSPVNGLSETTLDVTLEQLKSEMPLGINVHKSVAEASAYVSCGDLTL